MSGLLKPDVKEQVVGSKLLNAGQTCVAPDYLMLHIKHKPKFLKKYLCEKINVLSSGVCYFCSPGLTPGYVKLKLWNECLKSLLTTYKILLKDIISISN